MVNSPITPSDFLPLSSRQNHEDVPQSKHSTMTCGKRRLLALVYTAVVAGLVIFPTRQGIWRHPFFRNTSRSSESSNSMNEYDAYYLGWTAEQTTKFSSHDLESEVSGPNCDFDRFRPQYRRRLQDMQTTLPMPQAAAIVVVILMTLTSALFAGLILGLLSLDKTQLEIVMNNAADPKAAKNAKRIYPLRSNGNLLLCTLIWCNVGANVIQSILMAGLADPIVGFVISTVVLVIFAEILPQAVCSRHALEIGGFVAPFVKVLMYILFPISFPFAWILDKMLGHELGIIYTKAEFEQLLEIHAVRGGFNKEMASVMTGALKYQDVKVYEVMTPIDQVYMLSVDEKLSYERILAIFKAGHSRIPVCEGKNKNDVIGLLLTKDLIFVDPADEITVEAFVRIFGRGKYFALCSTSRLGIEGILGFVSFTVVIQCFLTQY